MKRPKHQPFARLPHPAASSTISSAPLAPAPLGNTPPPSPRLAAVVLLLQVVFVQLVWVLVNLYLNHHLLQLTRPPLLFLLLQYMLAKANLLFRAIWAQARAHPKAPKVLPPPQLKILLFSPLHPKKVKMRPWKGATKARIRARTRVAIKARVKGKVMIGKVDRTRSPPFRLVLGWVSNPFLILHFWHPLAPARRHLGRSGGWAASFVFLLCNVIVVWPLLSRRNGSLSSSPPFRLALAWGPPPSMTTLVGARCILKVQLTTIEVGPGFASSHPAHHHWGWPWIGNFLLFLYYLPYFFLLSGRPGRWNPKWFRSKVIILLLVLRRLLPWNGPKWSALSKFEEGTWVSLVRSPSTLPVLVVLALEPPFSSSYLMLLFTTLSLLQIDEMDVIFWNWICMVPSMCCPFSQVYLGWILHALEIFSLCPLYGSYWLRLWLLSFWTPLQRSGWASLFAGEEHLRGIWVSARCMPSSLVSRGFTKSWVGQVALRSPTNRHALDLLFHWTTKATRNEFLYRVHGAPVLICTFLDWDSRPTGSSLQARPGWLLFKLLCHRQSSLLATRSFLSSPCTIFDPTDFCHLRRRLII